MALPVEIAEAIERYSYIPRPPREALCSKHGQRVVQTSVSCDPRPIIVCINCGLEILK